MERCTQSDRIPIRSSSSTKVYEVSFKFGIPTCGYRENPGERLTKGCVAFAIGKNRASAILDGKRVKNGPDQAWCRHIDAAYDKGLVCTWRGTSIIPGICPECGHATTPVDVDATVP